MAHIIKKRARTANPPSLVVDLTGSGEVHKVNSIMQALRKEEAKFRAQLSDAQQQLDTIHAAMKLVSRGKATGKKHKRSSAARAKMSRAAKKRWAKIRAEKKST